MTAARRRCVACGGARERAHLVHTRQMEAACATVEGTRVPLDQLGSVTDTAALMKVRVERRL